ncbi:MAG TPA: FAD binding domain-containing protein [Gemmatimonadota bacterium]|nr:FAD binding domain-containing protein [Gemmatimonadota bacterium]
MPHTLPEALALIADDRDIVPIAGGTDLLVHWPVLIEAHDRTYLDLWGIPELRQIHWTDEALELGALATYWDVVRDPAIGAELPLLVQAARQVGAIQIQSRGTWAGNIANGSPAADGVPVLMACDATVVLASRADRREVPLADFYRGYKEMEMRDDELIVAVRIPRRPRSTQGFFKVGSRRAQAIAKVGLALVRSESGWRVVAASVAPTVRRCPSIEALLEETAVGNGSADLDSPEDLLPAIRRDIAPIDDLRSRAAYRERVLARVLFFAIQDGAGLSRTPSRP